MQNILAQELQGISFDYLRGKFSDSWSYGCWRSELARAVFGADPIDCGEVKVNGKHVKFDRQQMQFLTESPLSETGRKKGLRSICVLPKMLRSLMIGNIEENG
jgi:ABC-type sugar transport system ATPase subunit